MFEGFGFINKYFERLDKKRNIFYEMDNDLKEQLFNWGGSEYFEDVLWKVLDLEFNLDEDKKIYLKRIDTKTGLSFYWGYDPDVGTNNRIDFRIGPGYAKYGRYTNPINEITLSWDCYKRRYICEGDIKKKDFNGFGLEKLSDYYIKDINGNKYKRLQDECDLNIYIENNNNKIKIVCRRRIEDKLINEEELINYLVNQINNSSINLEEVFNKIYEIAFNDGEVSAFKLYLYNGNYVDYIFEFDEFKYYRKNVFERNYRISNRGAVTRYTRCIPYGNDNNNSGMLVIQVDNKDYKVIFDVRLNNSCEVVLNNEMELRKYLSSLEFPFKIEDLYKKISEISLDNIDKYALIELKILYKDKDMGVISLENGKLNLFHTVSDGKEITIDKTGYFSYKKEDKETKMYLSLNDNVVTKCEYISNNPFRIDIDGIVENPFQKGIIDAKNERIRTRKLIDEIVKNERK